MNSSVLTIILTGIIAGFGWMLKHEIEKRREIEKQLAEKKYSVYTSIIGFFFSVINNFRKNIQTTPEESADIMFKIAEDLMIYGSDSVVKKYALWKDVAGKEPDMTLLLMTDVILEIRKDMGNNATKVDMDDLWKMLIIDYDEFKPALLTAREKQIKRSSTSAPS